MWVPVPAGRLIAAASGTLDEQEDRATMTDFGHDGTVPEHPIHDHSVTDGYHGCPGRPGVARVGRS
jgi:hypothetical protein